MTTTRTGEPRTAGVVTWLVLAASFILSADTWHALGVLAGFGDRLSWLLPVSVDGYVTVALILWTAPVPAKVARFARTNTYAGALVGVSAQSSFHALTIFSATGYDWRVYLAAVVGALPPAVAGLAVHMRSLVRRESALRSTVTERETHRSPIVEVPRQVPPPPVDLPQVTAVAPVPAVPAPVPSADAAPAPAATVQHDQPDPATETPKRIKTTAASSGGRRTASETRKAALALANSGMDTIAVANTLRISERYARQLLGPGPTTMAEAAEIVEMAGASA